MLERLQIILDANQRLLEELKERKADVRRLEKELADERAKNANGPDVDDDSVDKDDGNGLPW